MVTTVSFKSFASPIVTATSTTTTLTTTAASVTTPVIHTSENQRSRLRSQSAGDTGAARGGQASARDDELDRIRLVVAGRTQKLSQSLVMLLNQVNAATGNDTRWADEELGRIQAQMDQLEEMESSVWIRLGTAKGKSARDFRMNQWKEWQAKQLDRVRQIQVKSWSLRQHRDDGRRGDSCGRSAGHVEKVKLPTFSGRHEEFSEFRAQFRELCKGERYTPVLEMAQLRLKLPREALTAITGLQEPEEAWKRLEELYGNRELQIMSAIKTLRDFRTAKSASHEQVIDLASAVQRCQTLLTNLDAMGELLGDRESLACIIQALPANVRDKWYDLKVPDDTRKRGEFLMTWLETQRGNAVRVRLDTMAAKLRTTNPPNSKAPSGTVQGESTDKGLVSSTLLAQGDGKLQDKSAPKAGERIEVANAEDAKKIADRRRSNLEAKKLDKCPICAQQHMYERTWSTAQPPVKAKLLSTHLTTCARFMAMDPEAKLAAVVGNAACLHCAAWDHEVHKFPGNKGPRDPSCSVSVNGSPCGGKHGRWYHEGSATGTTNSVIATASTQGPGLYEVYRVPMRAANAQAEDEQKTGMFMIDPGSDTNFVRQGFAQQLGLRGEPCQFRLKVVDREARPIKTVKYQLEVEDKFGRRHLIEAMGLETITTLPGDPDLSPIQKLVEGLPPDVIDRPQGEVDVLLGLRNSALHGSTVQQWDNLRLLESPLGCGWSLRGTHPDLQHASPRMLPSLSATAYALEQAMSSPDEELRVFHIGGQPEFHELDELGTAPPPVCLRCKGCRECTFRRRRLSPAEQEVVSRVEREMSVDTITGTITASYPWKNCVNRMMDNRRQAQRVQETMEKHMLAVGTHASYVEEMNKSIQEGKVRRLTQGEVEMWHGPVHYITTFAVLKPDSVTTKTRVVSNSAMRNARSKLSLNQCMWPGPNALCELYDCLIFWRAVEVAVVTDLKKAYQSIHTGPMELHLRRFLFRTSVKEEWLDYAFTRATFGDVAAGLILEVAKRRVAEMGQDIDPVAAEQLQKYSYVDDSILGGTKEDVDRMRGNRADGTYTGTVPQILRQGAMTVKFMAVSGSSDPWEAEQLGGKTLGVIYRLEEDEIVLMLKPGFYAGKAASSDQVREIVVLGPGRG